MKNLLLITCTLLLTVATMADPTINLKEGFVKGTPIIESISTIDFGPEGILFIGDSQNGSVIAVDTKDLHENKSVEALNVPDIQGKIAAMLGTSANNVIIHDLAVNPISQTPYLAISKANRMDLGHWRLPNDVAQATIILKVNADGTLEEFSLDQVEYSQTAINVIDADKGKNYRESSLRVDGITDLIYHQGKVYVAGLSNEEFASTLRVLDFPFNDKVQAASIEVYHAAHGEYETQAPVRTFVPYEFNGEPHIITAYTCTPLATFPLAVLQDGAMIKSKTVAEFGAGNIPMDMIIYQREGKDYLMIANSTRNLMRVALEDIGAVEQGLSEKVSGFGTAGVPFISLPSNGIQQIAYLNSQNILATVLTPGGTVDLRSLSTKWF